MVVTPVGRGSQVLREQPAPGVRSSTARYHVQTSKLPPAGKIRTGKLDILIFHAT
jgi:hypothetical protein